MTDSSSDTSRIERAILQSALKSMEQEPPKFGRGPALWLSVVLAMAVGFCLSWLDLSMLDGQLLNALEPLLALFFGMLLMWAIFRALAKAQWYFLRSFINSAGIKARLRELGA